MDLRDERGTLYEIPILIATVLVAIAIAAGQPTWGRAAVAVLLVVLAVAGGLGALVGIGFLLGWLEDRAWFKRLADSKRVQAAAAWFPSVLLAAFLAAAGAFFGLVIAEAFNASPAAQIRAGTASAIVLGLIPLAHRYFAGRKAGRAGK